MSLEDIYREVCREAQEEGSCFVSLYVKSQRYGGPEEGGWYATDVTLDSTLSVDSYSVAERMVEKMQTMLVERNRAEKHAWATHCGDTVEWCEARGLDVSYLQEPDGPDTYIVLIESFPGENARKGPTFYE